MNLLDLYNQLDSLYSENYKLLESPMIIDADLSSIYLDTKLISIIRRGLSEQAFVRHKFENKNILIYAYSKIGEIYVITEEKDNKTIFIGGTNIIRVKYCNKNYLQSIITKKFSEYKNFMLDIYRFANKFNNLPIISDNIQSESASNIWMNWFNNPKKYNINLIKAFYNCKEEIDKNKIWTKSQESKDYRLVIDFI